MVEDRQARNRGEQEPQPTVSRFILELNNGKVRYLEGEDAQRHMEQINYVLKFMQEARRNMFPKDFLDKDWKEVDVADAGKIFQQSQEPPQEQGNLL